MPWKSARGALSSSCRVGRSPVWFRSAFAQFAPLVQEAALADDERVVALRTEIERQARAQHDEGTITTADYIETRTDVLDAHLALQRHRVELAQARATYLTTLGFVPREGAQQP